jgi:hypothetical protein
MDAHEYIFFFFQNLNILCIFWSTGFFYYTWKLEMEGNAGGTRKLGKEPVYSVRVKLNMEEAHVILQHRRMSLTLQKK